MESFVPQKSGVIGPRRIADVAVTNQTANPDFLDFLKDLDIDSIDISVNLNEASTDNAASRRPKVSKRRLDEALLNMPILFRHVQIEANFSLLPLLTIPANQRAHWMFPDSAIYNGGINKMSQRIVSSISRDEYWSSSYGSNANSAIIASGSTPEQTSQIIKSLYLTWQKATMILMSQLSSHQIDHFYVLGESSFARISSGSDVFASAVFQASKPAETMTCTLIGVTTALMARLQALGCDPSVLAEETSAFSQRGMSTSGQMERASRGVDVVVSGRVACLLAMECLKEAVLDLLLRGGGAAGTRLPLLLSETPFEGASPHYCKVVADACQHRFDLTAETTAGTTAAEGDTHKVHLSGPCITVSDIRDVVERLITLGREVDDRITASAAGTKGTTSVGQKRRTPSAAYSYVQKSVLSSSSSSTTSYNAALWRGSNSSTSTGASASSAAALSNPMTVVTRTVAVPETTAPAGLATSVATTAGNQVEEPFFLVELVVQTPRIMNFLYGESQLHPLVTARSSSATAAATAAGGSGAVACADVVQDIYWYPTMREEMMTSQLGAKKSRTTSSADSSGSNSNSNKNSSSVDANEYVEVTLLPQPLKQLTRQSGAHPSVKLNKSSSVNSGSGGNGSSFRAPADSEETVLEPLNHTKNSRFAVDYVR